MRTNSTTPADETTLFLGDGWPGPLEAGIRERIRGFIEELIEEELAAALGRGRYERRGHDDEGPRSRRAMPCRFPVTGTAIASASSSAPLARSRLPSRGRAQPLRAGPTRRATSISLLVVLGVRRGGQKVLLAVKNMGSESEAA